ncbi:MAG: hypothetical protein CXT73_03845 [Methanobacteriota archaeon]|jgi:hypothetical protein|nr:MAG: hypothetical protein CXT73_03845 [Euryarchaeota archaeon]
MQIDQVIQEKLVKIPEKIFETFSNHLEQEILNYLYHYKISKWDYEPEHDRIKNIVAKIAKRKNVIIDPKWTKSKNNIIEAEFGADEFPNRYTPKTEKEGGIARLQIVYNPSADKNAEGTHQRGVRKNKWLHIIKVVIGNVTEDLLIQNQPKEQFREIFYIIERAKSTLRHELMHLTQEHVLDKTTSRRFNQKTGDWSEDEFAFTGQANRLPGYDDEGSDSSIHNLSPVEFDPMIDTEASRFRYSNYDRTKSLPQQIKDYVSHSEFFGYLRDYDTNRFNKAVKKFAQRVNEIT